MVVVRSLDQDLLGFAKMTFDRPLHVRFIEYMPVGDAGEHSVHRLGTEADGWSEADHVPTDEVVERIADDGAAAGLGELTAVARDDAPGGWGPARYYRFPGALGTIGVISPLSHHFCGECNRLRLTADGRLRTCLFSDDELDVRGVLRTGTDADVRARRPQGARGQARGPRHARRHRPPHVPDRRLTDGQDPAKLTHLDDTVPRAWSTSPTSRSRTGARSPERSSRCSLRRSR